MLCCGTKIKIIISGLLFMMESCTGFLLPAFEINEYDHDDEYLNFIFSDVVNADSFIRNFSIKEDGADVDGTFNIDGNNVKFYPLEGIKYNYEYEIIIDENVEANDGRSLKNKFYWSFNNRKETIRPWIVSGQSVGTKSEAEGLFNYEINFSEPIDEDSVIDSISIKPSIDYTVEFSEDGTTCRIYSLKTLDMSKDYILCINENVMDLCRNSMKEKFIDVVSMKKCDEEPIVTFFCNGNLIDQNSLNENLQKECDVELLFDRKVDMDVISSYVSVVPKNVSYKVDPDYVKKDRLSVSFNVNYGTECLLVLEKGVKDLYGNTIKEDKEIKLCFNNEKNRTVEFISAYIQTGDGVFQKLDMDNIFTCLNFDPTYYPADGTVNQCVLLLFFMTSEYSEGVDLYSAMKSIYFNTSNSCCTVTPKKVDSMSQSILEDFGYGEIDPSGGKYSGIRYVLNMNNQSRNGLFEIIIGKDLKDSLGNTIDGKISLAYNK